MPISLNAGYRHSQRPLDTLLAEAKNAVAQRPQDTASFTYFGVEVNINTNSNINMVRRYVLVALRGLAAPVVPAGPLKPTALGQNVHMPFDNHETEGERKTRLLEAMDKAADAMRQELLQFEALANMNLIAEPFQLATWVMDVTTLLKNPLTPWEARQSFNCMVAKYSDVLRTAAQDEDCTCCNPLPYQKAYLQALSTIKNLMESCAYNKVPHGPMPLDSQMQVLTDAHNALLKTAPSIIAAE